MRCVLNAPNGPGQQWTCDLLHSLLLISHTQINCGHDSAIACAINRNWLQIINEMLLRGISFLFLRSTNTQTWCSSFKYTGGSIEFILFLHVDSRGPEAKQELTYELLVRSVYKLWVKKWNSYGTFSFL